MSISHVKRVLAMCGVNTVRMCKLDVSTRCVTRVCQQDVSREYEGRECEYLDAVPERMN